METKICNKCRRELPISMFFKNRTHKDGLRSQCKECEGHKIKAITRKEYKVCCKCKRELPVKMFARDKITKDGLRGECKECRSKYLKQHYKNYKCTTIGTKICRKCGKELPVDMFYKDKTHEDGLRSQCKRCVSKNEKKRYENNREYIIKQVTKYAQENSDKRKLYLKKYYEINKDRIADQKKEHYNENKQEVKKRSKIYQRNNLDKFKIYNQRRKARKNKLPSTLTNEQWNQIKQHFNNECAYCGRELPLQQEHFIPVVKAGEYTMNNIIPACKTCNNSKHDKDFFKWYPRQKYYSKKREKKILDFLKYKGDKQQLSII